MSSTRLRNQVGEYRLQQSMNGGIYDNRIQSMKRLSSMDAIPQAGIMISHMPSTVLSENAVDIENQLYGIGSSDLVNRRKVVQPKLRNLPDVYHYKPTDIYIPEPLIIEKNQRPII